MALVIRQVLLGNVRQLPLVQAKRFRGKLNLKRPKQLHFERAAVVTLTKPYFDIKPNLKKQIEVCAKLEQLETNDEDNPYQRLIAGRLMDKIKQSRLIAFYHLNPMSGDDAFWAYIKFRRVNMHFENYGKKTLEMAVKGTPYEALLQFYVSHNMIVFSEEPEIKKLLQVSKKFPQIVLLAAVLEGKLVSKDELVHYSTIPSLQSAQASLVQTLNSVGGQLVSHLNGHQNTLVSHLQQRVKQLEDG